MTTPPPLKAPPRYLLVVALVFLILYTLPFLLIRAPRFDQWAQSPFGQVLEYGFTVRHLDADVLIFGDSTALYGLDTVRMSSALGVHVFNLPNIQPSILATRDVGLNRYLQHNRPPRLLVLYFAPWDLDFAHQPINTAIYDGDEMLLRHGTLAEITDFYRHHLDELLSFPFKFYRVQSPAGLPNLFHPRPGPPAIARMQGHAIIHDYPALAPSCTLRPDLAHSRLAYTSAQELVRRYTTPETRVLVYVAPIAGCRGAELLSSRDYRPIPAAPPRILPPASIVQDGYFAHPRPEAIPQTTGQLTEAIRPLLQ